MNRDLVKELFGHPRPLTHRGEWLLSFTPDETSREQKWRAGGIEQALEMAADRDCPVAGLDSLMLHGFYDSGVGVWRLKQILDAQGRVVE